MSDSGAVPPFVLNGLTVLVGMSRFFGSFTVERGRLTFEPSQGLITEALNVEEANAIVHTELVFLVIAGQRGPRSRERGGTSVDGGLA